MTTTGWRRMKRAAKECALISEFEELYRPAMAEARLASVEWDDDELRSEGDPPNAAARQVAGGRRMVRPYCEL